MRKKLVIVGIVVIILAGLGFGGYTLLQPHEQISSKLSSRSQQFIKKERMDASSQWTNVNLDKSGKPQTRNTRVSVENCFSFVIKFQIENSRQDGQCMGYFAISDPTGKIVAYRRTGAITDFDSVEGVSLRRNHPETYTETSKTINGRNFLIFTTKEGSWEANAFTYGDDHYLVFNLQTSGNESKMDDLVAMLGSIEMGN